MSNLVFNDIEDFYKWRRIPRIFSETGTNVNNKTNCPLKFDLGDKTPNYVTTNYNQVVPVLHKKSDEYYTKFSILDFLLD